MYTCMYVVSDRVIMDHDYFMLMIIYMYVSMYLCHSMTGFQGSFFWRMISYADELHEEVPDYEGRVALKDLWGQYHVDMN